MDASGVVAIVGVVASAATGFGGVWLGSSRATRTARQLAADQREWTERQQIREHQEQAAKLFDGELLTLMSRVPQGNDLADNVRVPLGTAYNELEEIWRRHEILGDEEIRQRYFTLNSLIFMAYNDSVGNAGQELNLWPLRVAYEDLRNALRGYLLREPPAQAALPRSTEVIALANPGGTWAGVRGVFDYLIDREVQQMSQPRRPPA
jgi:hypothetical protein